MVLSFELPPSGQCSLSPRGYRGHAVAQKNFKRLLLRVRGSNSFQLSRMHLKGVCQEVDWLFPIWNTVMTGREKKKKLIGLLLFYWWTFLGVSLSEAYHTQYCYNLRVRCTWGQGADPQAGWGVTVLLRSNLWAGRSRSTSWDPLTGVGHPQGLQHHHCWVGLRGCNLNSLLFCPPWMGIDIMM